MNGLGINFPGLATQIVSFTILLAVLIKILYRPVQKTLSERTERIRESLAAADRAAAEASTAAERVEAQIVEARTEGQKLIAEAREAASRYREEQERRARGDAEALVERARADIGRERDAAVEQVRQEFAGLAIYAAERIVGKSLDETIHRDLIESALREGLEDRKN